MHRVELPTSLFGSAPLRAPGAWDRRLRPDVARWCDEHLEGWWRLVFRGRGDAVLVVADREETALFRLRWL